MPEISKFYGIAIYMYISDHYPPHFHVLLDNWERLQNSESPVKIEPLR